MTKKALASLCVAGGLTLGFAASVSDALAADRIKMGFLATFSGPLGVVGTQMRDALNLGMDHLGGRLGGLTTEILIEDDQGKPENAVQIASRWVQQAKVDVVGGVIFSNVMMAIHRPITESRTVLISANAGPSPIAGERCSEYFFSTSWQGDNYSEAMGAHLQKLGVDEIYLMAPNYQAGKDVLAGFKRFFKGKVAGEVYTTLGQPDYSAELAQLRAANPKAVFIFYPGGMGVNFLKQFAAAGLKGKIPLYTSYTVDNSTLPGQGASALDVVSTTFWAESMTNPANQRFVTDFRKKYNYAPAEYAAQTYDMVMLIDSAIRKVGGKIEDKPAWLAAFKAADFKSVRGNFKFNRNQFPIQDFYWSQVVAGAGGAPTIRLGDVVLKDHSDAYAGQCKM